MSKSHQEPGSSDIHVADGDTLTVLDDVGAIHRVRLLGIDLPELGRGKNLPGQPFESRSRQQLQILIHSTLR